MPITLEEAREEGKQIALTERWTPLKPHAKQSEFFWSDVKFRWCPAGRRSGKSEIEKRKKACNLLRTFNGAPARMLIGAPTYSRVKDIFFNDMRDLIPKHWIKRIKESTQELEFKTHWNATIRLVGMNKPQVVEGVPWNDATFDELANYPPRIFEKHILQAFGTEGVEQTASMIGTPDDEGGNQVEYEKYFEIASRYPEQPTHKAFWWPSTDIVSKETIDTWQATMDQSTFKQEVLGHFIHGGGKAFSAFSNDIHVNANMAEYSSFLPICVSHDFGVRPSACVIGQHYKNQIWILDEVVLHDGDTDTAAMAVIDRCNERGYSLRQGLFVYGDAAGRSPHSNTGESDYLRLREYYKPFNPQFRNLMYNPLIKDSINAIRLKLSDTRGMATMFIHPRCETLKLQLKTAPWPDKLEDHHTLAALRYFVFSLFGYNARQGGVTGFGRADLVTENQRLSAKYTR